jgi:hypothetical protein
MSSRRIVVPAALIALTFASLASGQNRQHRRAVWANRPNRTAGYAPYYANAAYRGTPATGDVQTLTQAYSTLASADHDYKGHRIKAMQAIKKAARMMGQRLGGDGKAKEPQTLSDQQLRGVQSMLQKVRGTVGGRNSQRVVQRINEAIQHVTVALSIK